MIPLAVVVLIALCAIFYRLGGKGGVWWRNTKVRDWGCTLCCIIILCLIQKPSVWMALQFFLLWGALTQYWKGDKADCEWYHWFAHGLGCAIAFIPYSYFTGHMTAWYIQLAICSIGMCVWSEYQDDDDLEELGRGLILGASCLLYLIG